MLLGTLKSRFRTTLFVLAAIGLGSCTAPEFPRRVSVVEVVNNARCEFYLAVMENKERYKWLVDWTAQFSFSFFVEQTGGASADTTFLVPVDLGAFSLNLKANAKGTARGTYAFTVKLLKGLDEAPQLPCMPHIADSLGSRRHLAGELGLRRWLNQVVPHVDEVNRTAKGPPVLGPPLPRKYSWEGPNFSAGRITDLTYTIEFVVAIDGSISPSWALTFPSKRQAKPAFGVSASENNTHKLIVTMTTIPRADALDYTIVKRKIGDQEFIVSRNICVVNAGTDCPIPDDLKELETALADIEKAKKEQKAQQRALEMAVPQEFKHLPPAAVREKLLKNELPQDRTRGVERRAVTDKLRQAQERIDEAKRDERAAKRRLDDAVTTINRTREVSDRAREDEASRRLDALLQQQLLRDAFRN